jgi:hypothetical protein
MNVSWHLIICQKERMGWDGMGWAGGEFGYHPQLLFFFFWVQNNNTHTFKLIIPYLNISGRLYSRTFLTSP